MRYATQTSTPGAPGNLAPFKYDGNNGLASRPVQQSAGPRVPISYGTQAPMGNALGIASVAPSPTAAYDSYRMQQISSQPQMSSAPLPDVQSTIRALAAHQGSMPMQAVASRTHGTVGGLGNAAWC